MKKRLLFMFVIVIITCVLCGCSGKSAVGKDLAGNESKAADNAAVNSEEASKDLEKAAEDLGKAMEYLATEGWPKDKIPADIPEYTGGSIVNSGGDTSTYYIKVDKTSKEELDKYLNKLKDSGWSVSEGSSPGAKKTVAQLEFNWHSESFLQISVHVAEVGKWPKDKLPSDIFPPDNCTFIGDVEIIENEAGRMWYFNYECSGVNEAAARDYFKKLMENGWSGDSSMLSKDFMWEGKDYNATIEIYETTDNSTTFTCNFSISE